MKKIKKVLICILSIFCMMNLLPAVTVAVYADETNIAQLYGTAFATNLEATKGGPERLNDGDLNNYIWANGKEFDAGIEFKDGNYYNIDKIRLVFNPGTQYTITVSYLDKDTGGYVKLCEGSSDDTVKVDNLLYFEYAMTKPITTREVKVSIVNQVQEAVASTMNEIQLFGAKDEGGTGPIDPVEPEDKDNIALGKKVRSHASVAGLQNIVDGNDTTRVEVSFAPAYFDIDLEQNYDLTDITVKMPVTADRFYYFTIYGSKDGSNYDRLYQERSKDVNKTDGYKIDLTELEDSTYRIVRINIERVSDTAWSYLSEVYVHGKATGENIGELRAGTADEILNMKPFSQTEYATEITEAETIENVYGIIDRILGSKYRSWFLFDIKENDRKGHEEYDYYTVASDSISGKILITGNDGISLATGLNYYLKTYCKVSVSEQANQVKMPDSIIPVLIPVYNYTEYELRYAFNYCTLSYTFAYADAKEFQRENDWLALNGVNCVIDLAGQEAVWIKFLMNYGYSFDDAKDWIAGPAYSAWQFMGNLETVGGPVSDEWVIQRLEMARENQRWKRSLGMQTVLQGYAGMVPNNFSKYQPDIPIIDQGAWCGLPRPDMIRTDNDYYDALAEEFYKAQDWAFGPTSDYYAVDPFHEGGIKPADLDAKIIAEEVLDSLLTYDKDAVWMVQAWWENPSNALLQGMGEFREDHVIILDLCGLERYYTPKWNSTTYTNPNLDSIEFNGTSWVWCMLENYGGNPSMDGTPQQIIDRITYAKENSEHMKGIGFISEATYDNPIIYELVLDMAWQHEEVVLSDWLDEYVIRRYGGESKSARQAWDLLLETVYSTYFPSTQVMVPQSGGDPSIGMYGLNYDSGKLEKALKLLYRDFNELSDSEAYRYDLTEIMRQVVNNYAVSKDYALANAYNTGNLEEFILYKDEFLNSFDVLDDVLATQQELLGGEWIGSAANWAIDTGADDFAFDSMTANAKTMITLWATSSNLTTYAWRNYEGMMRDIYKPIWAAWLQRHQEVLETNNTLVTTPRIDYTQHCIDWIYTNWADQEDSYVRIADNSPENMKIVVDKVLTECSTMVISPENAGNLAYDKFVEFNYENPVTPGGVNGGYASNVTDGITETYWDGGPWPGQPDHPLQTSDGEAPYVIIDLEKEYELDKLTVINYPIQTRYYFYNVYVSSDKENWEKVIDREKVYGTIPQPQTGDDYTFDTNKPSGRYVKLVGLYNSDNEAFHVKEIRVFGTLAEIADYSAVDNAIAQVEALNKDDYIDFSAVEAAVDAVVRGLSKADQTKVDNMAKAIEDAIAALELKPIDLNKTALEIVIEMAKAITQEQLDKVVPAVANEFIAALENAKTVYAKASASQEEVDNAFDRLAKVMQMLEFYKGDKIALEKMMNQIANLKAEDYTDSTWNVLQTILPSVNEVLGNVNAMQEEVDQVYSELVKAFINLRLKPNKDLLEDLINQANGLNSANYTAASWGLFEPELARANAVLNDPEATKEQVDNAVNALTKAIAGLEEINPNNPPVVDNNVKTPNIVKSGDTTVNAIKTGDTDLIGLFACLSMLSVVGLNLLRKKEN